MPPRRRGAVGAGNNSRGVQFETFVLDPKAVELSKEMCNKLEANRELDVRAPKVILIPGCKPGRKSWILGV